MIKLLRTVFVSLWSCPFPDFRKQRNSEASMAASVWSEEHRLQLADPARREEFNYIKCYHRSTTQRYRKQKCEDRKSLKPLISCLYPWEKSLLFPSFRSWTDQLYSNKMLRRKLILRTARTTNRDHGDFFSFFLCRTRHRISPLSSVVYWFDSEKKRPNERPTGRSVTSVALHWTCFRDILLRSCLLGLKLHTKYCTI